MSASDSSTLYVEFSGNKARRSRHRRRCCLHRHTMNSSDSENAEPESPRRLTVRYVKKSRFYERYLKQGNLSSTDSEDERGKEHKLFRYKQRRYRHQDRISHTEDDAPGESSTPESVCCSLYVGRGYHRYTSSESDWKYELQLLSDLEISVSEPSLPCDVDSISESDKSDSTISPSSIYDSTLNSDCESLSDIKSHVQWNILSSEQNGFVDSEPKLPRSKTDLFKNQLISLDQCRSIIDERNNALQGSYKCYHNPYCKLVHSISSVPATNCMPSNSKQYIIIHTTLLEPNSIIVTRRSRATVALITMSSVLKRMCKLMATLLEFTFKRKDPPEGTSEGSKFTSDGKSMSPVPTDIILYSYKFTSTIKNLLPSPLPEPEYFNYKETMINYDSNPKDYGQHLLSEMLTIDINISRKVARYAPVSEDCPLSLPLSSVCISLPFCSQVAEDSSDTNSCQNLNTESFSYANESDYHRSSDDDKIRKQPYTMKPGTRPYHLTQSQFGRWGHECNSDESKDYSSYYSSEDDISSSSPVYRRKKKAVKTHRNVICLGLITEYEYTTSTSD